MFVRRVPLIAIGMLLIAPAATSATAIHVNSTADTTTSASVCTLRDAITAANGR
jgi:CSLREA domain-containing protein